MANGKITCIECGATSANEQMARAAGWVVEDTNGSYIVDYGNYTGEVEKHADGELPGADEEIYRIAVTAAIYTDDLSVEYVDGPPEQWIWYCPPCREAFVKLLKKVHNP